MNIETNNSGINIIFLDVDGVLNCKETTDRCDRYIGIDDKKNKVFKTNSGSNRR